MAKQAIVRRGREFFEGALAVRTREGLTYEQLSARTGVPMSTLQRWGRRLTVEAREAARAPGSPFVELVSATSDAPIEVHLRSGHVLFLEAGPPSAGLAQLVAVLESC